jgi:hypothetical protein
LPTSPSSALRGLPGRAWRAAADPKRAWREAVVAADLARWRRSARPYRAASGGGDRVALVITLYHTVHQLKLEAILAKALELHGFRPVLLTLRSSRWARPYFEAFGLEEVVYFDDFVDPELRRETERTVSAFLASGPSVQALKDFEFRGAHVGQQTLSSLSRRFERGRISLADPAVEPELGRLLREAVRSVLGAERLLDAVEPELAIFNEKGYAGLGSIYDVALARGTNVVNFVAAGIHNADALIFKRYTEETRRVHPTSLSAESWRAVREQPWGEQQERELDEEFRVRYDGSAKHPDAGLQEGKRIKSADEVRGQLGLDPAKPTVVLFSHILWDANLFYGEDLFEDQETWLVETVRAAAANPHANWVVKLHPANAFKMETSRLNDEEAIREAVSELPAHVQLLRPETDINTFSLFAVADAGVTIRGTIGLELPCFGIPVLTAGTGRYSGLGFTNDSRTAEEYLGKLARAHELPRLSPAETELARRHAHAIFRLRPFPFTSYRSTFRSLAQPHHPLVTNLELTLRAEEQVRRAEDLREFAAWAADRERLDYLRV